MHFKCIIIIKKIFNTNKRSNPELPTALQDLNVRRCVLCVLRHNTSEFLFFWWFYLRWAGGPRSSLLPSKGHLIELGDNAPCNSVTCWMIIKLQLHQRETHKDQVRLTIVTLLKFNGTAVVQKKKERNEGCGGHYSDFRFNRCIF